MDRGYRYRCGSGRGCGCGRGCCCGGLSWKDVVVFLCACLNNALVSMVLMGLTTLFPDWQASFHSDRASTASVQALGLGVLTGGGVIAGMVGRKLGQRRSMLLGSFLFSGGFFAGGFAESLPVLTFCIGGIAGSGMSLLNLVNMATFLQRFSRRAGFVASVAGLAATLAMLPSPFCVRYLTDMYTWRGCLFLASGINLHTFLFSLLVTSPLLQTDKTPGAHSPAAVSPCQQTTEQQESGDIEAVSPCQQTTEQQESGDIEAVSPCQQTTEQQESGDIEAASLHNSGCHGGHKEESPGVLGDDAGQRTGSSRRDPSPSFPLFNDDTKDRLCGDPKTNARSDNDSAEVSPSHDHKRSLDSLTEDAAATDYSVKNVDDPVQDLTRLPNDAVTCSNPVKPDVVSSQSEHEQTSTNKNLFPGEKERQRLNRLKNGPEKEDQSILKTQQENVHTYQDPNEIVCLETEPDSREHEVSPTKESCHCRDDADQSGSRAEEERCGDSGEGRGRRWTRQLHLLTRPLYLAVILSSTLKTGTGIAFLNLLLDYSTSRHWTQSDGLFLNFIFMIVNLAASVLAALICLQPKDCSVGISIAGGVIGGVAYCVLGQVKDYTLAACAVAGMAISYRWGFSMYSPCVLRAAEVKDYPLALGFCLTMIGLGIVALTRLAGFLVDLHESYSPVTLIYGIAMFVAEGNLFFFSRWHQQTPAAVSTP